ncbi:hypothetical protein RND81_06G023700 [Saponaria officinalis]|uniref:Fe2OG dioxygenase domain-containing protein n=1 Tax=Saponaria officinalis TaxID=3572 RepID=A0AAW1K802_SAPOF
MKGEKIPIINLQENNSSQKIRELCEKMGYFRIINHGIPTKLMGEIKSVVINLFDRPEEIKQKNTQKIPGSGYLGANQYNPTYESLSVDITSSQTLPTFFNHIQASPTERKIIEKYTQAIQKLGFDIVRKMFGDYSTQVGVTHFRMNKYNITRDNVGSDGLGLHTDTSLITILRDDEHLGGLEIINPSGKVVPVDHLPGSLLVMLGDIAVVQSNGRYRNVLHRVTCKDVGVRFSIATFITPSTNENIKVHSKFKDVDNPPKYVPFKYEELRRLRVANKFFCGEVLELLRCKN